MNEKTPRVNRPALRALAHLHQIAAVALGVVDLEGDEVLPFDAGAVAVVDAHALTLEAQLEELALGDGHFHLGGFAGHLRIDDVLGGYMRRRDSFQLTKWKH